MKSTWTKVVQFFNENYFAGPNYQTVWRGRFISNKRFKKAPLTLIETYRLYLTRAGYIEHRGRGLYQIVCPIPSNLTSKACYRRAYNK